jgi:hypothetical protein
VKVAEGVEQEDRKPLGLMVLAEYETREGRNPIAFPPRRRKIVVVEGLWRVDRRFPANLSDD